MFGSLTEKFQSIIEKVSLKKELTEEGISDAVRATRLALLDADVGYKVVSAFIKRVKEKAIGLGKTKGISAGDQFIGIVHEELVALMGKEEPELKIQSHRTKILLCGLQGAGKTTCAAKLAHYFQRELKKSVALVALDMQRPAAIEQLTILGKQVGAEVIIPTEEKSPALKDCSLDVIIFDTAGRLHVDDDLMDELSNLKRIICPDHVFFVANCGAGQGAVDTAKEFDDRVGITGSILTMVDGASRAGAAISIVEVTGKPLLFEGVGEKIEDLQIFNPTSMADRILGMGDVINLVKRAERQMDEKESAKLEEKFKNASFTFEDYLGQMSMMQKMGPLKGLMKMLPGMNDISMIEESEKNFSITKAIIQSMTLSERRGKVEIVPSRRKRIAKGSGTTMEDVNKLLKSFKMLKKFSKEMPAMQKKLKKSGQNMESMKHFDRFFS